MTPSEEPDGEPRRRSATEADTAKAPEAETAKAPEAETAKAPEAETAKGQSADAGSPRDPNAATGEADAAREAQTGKTRQAIGKPIDPYADPFDGAGPYAVPTETDGQHPEAEESPEGPYGPLDGTLIINEPYRSGRPLRTEQERLDQYRHEQDEEALPKPGPGVIGYYPAEQKIPSHPTDSVRQFSSFGGSPPRKRRSDWPVLVFALVVATAVTAGCCLAGFGLFSTWNPFHH
jgi:hypothetical protein